MKGSCNLIRQEFSSKGETISVRSSWFEINKLIFNCMLFSKPPNLSNTLGLFPVTLANLCMGRPHL